MNKTKFTLTIAFLICISFTFAQKKIGNETAAQKEQRVAWWKDGRFGMFIHWGLYSMAARHEWVKNHEHITNEGYQKYFDLYTRIFSILNYGPNKQRQQE
jgi:alpha-L-fucosidase